ncbi:uncharacterized protein B0H64DRAFT_169233 [Chaetomium fimeti]|uniref:Uncharacterized protein n=1 Tax=Chaetomium fimeti TaxID=1854472 RepID=A0AAE0LTM5_9PEZI|nr:hypothetical protein B0H64DRAFT_169233 [Chaetomium fimeti]
MKRLYTYSPKSKLIVPGPLAVLWLPLAVRVKALVPVAHDATFGTFLDGTLLLGQPESFVQLPPYRLSTECPGPRKAGMEPGKSIVGQSFQGLDKSLVGRHYRIPLLNSSAVVVCEPLAAFHFCYDES